MSEKAEKLADLKKTYFFFRNFEALPAIPKYQFQ